MFSAIIIDKYKCQDTLWILQNCLNHMGSTRDCLSFYNAISKSIHLLFQLSTLVRTKENKFGVCLPTSMLTHIFSFLPVHLMHKVYPTCKLWKETWSSPFMQRLLQSRKPVGASWVDTWDVEIDPYKIGLTKKNIFLISSRLQVLKILESNKNHLSPTVLIHEGHNYGCAALTEEMACLVHAFSVHLLDLKTRKVVEAWEVFPMIHGVAIQEKWIYVLSIYGITIFTFKGILMHRWKFPEQTVSQPRSFAVFQEKIFVLDAGKSFIYVFTYMGILLSQWSTIKKTKKFHPGRVSNGIAVTHQNVFMVDQRSKRIQARTHEGEFVFDIHHPQGDYLLDICVLEDRLFVADFMLRKIWIFQLHY